MMKIKERIQKIRKYISEEIWQLDTDDFSRFKARIIRDVKVLIITIRTFSAQKIGFQAVALSFFCTMAVVPFISFAFVITGGLGLDGVLKNLLYANFDNQQVIDTVLRFSDNIIRTSHSSVLGLISALLFVWLVIWMMMCVESVFNNVWKVKKSRNIFKRFSFYIAILCLSPFIIMLFFSGSIVYSHILDSLVPNKIAFSESIKSFLGWIVFCIISILTFSAMYKFVPNFKVKYSCAIMAAVFSGVVFTLLQYLYLETQVFVTRLNAIYGAVAAIPLFMFWLNFGWFIILFGAELSYAFQSVDDYNIIEK
ncbi:MAG: YihY/virulence factor BrkB family protein [Bacteroidales bacterium]|nr:YihY/virulence factor BrkB family protein [Bacteroidales bacterium]MCI1786035.1 YihY/virulence factor BrkB family protein [Bacteroidales bacterium]